MTGDGGGRRPPPARQEGGRGPGCGSSNDAGREDLEMEEGGRSPVYCALPVGDEEGTPRSMEPEVSWPGGDHRRSCSSYDGELGSGAGMKSLGDIHGSGLFLGRLDMHGRLGSVMEKGGTFGGDDALMNDGGKQEAVVDGGSFHFFEAPVDGSTIARCSERMQLSPATVEAASMDVPMDGSMGSYAAVMEESHAVSGAQRQVMGEAEESLGPLSSAEFCIGSCSRWPKIVNPSSSVSPVNGVAGNFSGANSSSRLDDARRVDVGTCTQHVCGNDQRTSFSVKEMRVGHDASWPGQNGAGSAWQRPRMVAMPPLDDLGEFSVDGATAVLDPAEVEITSQRFAAALVGRLFGRRIPFNVLNGELKRRWAAHGNFKIITMAGDCFICFFECIQARDDVLRGGPWVILGQVLGIDVWTPAFSPGASFAFSTPVWVRMPRLPLYCWSSRNIGRIAAMVGEPLWLDGATADLERCSFARTCVRIDLAKPLKSGVWVEGPYGKFFQPFVYEGLSVFCCRCGRVGHKEAVCTLVPPIGDAHVDSSVVSDGTCRIDASGDHEQVGSGCLVQAEKLTVNSGTESAPPAVSVMPVTGMVGAGEAEEKGVGPWMMVERRRRSSKPGHSGGRLPRHLEQMKVGHDKSLLGPFHFAGSSRASHLYSGLGELRMAVPGSVYPIKNNLQKSVGSKNMSSSVLPKVDVEYSAHTNTMAHLSNNKGSNIISSFSALSQEDAGRLSSALPKVDMESSAHTMAHLSNDKGGNIISSFSAQSREDAGRLSSAKERSWGDRIRGAKKEKMKSDLGPIKLGSRKRRKAYSSTDGGDGSPTRPP